MYDEYVRIIRVRVNVPCTSRTEMQINTKTIRRKPTNVLRILLEKPYTTRERIMSYVSPYSRILWVTATI